MTFPLMRMVLAGNCLFLAIRVPFWGLPHYCELKCIQLGSYTRLGGVGHCFAWQATRPFLAMGHVLPIAMLLLY
jgi:hypothetical protein